MCVYSAPHENVRVPAPRRTRSPGVPRKLVEVKDWGRGERKSRQDMRLKWSAFGTLQLISFRMGLLWCQIEGKSPFKND